MRNMRNNESHCLKFHKRGKRALSFSHSAEAKSVGMGGCSVPLKACSNPDVNLTQEELASESWPNLRGGMSSLQ